MEENIKHDATTEEKFDERVVVDAMREDGKITSYNFKILVKDKPSLEGNMTRDEVELMYRLYAADGANLTRRTVSRYFPLYTFQEFKKILTAFSITKASAPFAPHIVEEKTTDELIQLSLERKENDYLKQWEHSKDGLFQQKYKDLLKINAQLKRDVASFKEFLGDIKFDFTLEIKHPVYHSDKTLVVYLSDMHVGAEVSDYSVYNNTYDRDVVFQRMQKVIDKIMGVCHDQGITNIVICNIGDSLDGYNQQTTRGGHNLPQNMNNKDQYKTYVGVMLNLFKVLSESAQFETIEFVCVEGGNHDGDFGFVANKALEASLEYLNPEIKVTIFEQFMDSVEIQGHTFVMCHGKDARDMFKNLPLTINDKTENQINEYLDTFGITGKISFIKGDLHQTATTYAKRFRYKSVASFFGSSEWIHKNFGNTKAFVDFDIVTPNEIFESRIAVN